MLLRLGIVIWFISMMLSMAVCLHGMIQPSTVAVWEYMILGVAGAGVLSIVINFIVYGNTDSQNK